MSRPTRLALASATLVMGATLAGCGNSPNGTVAQPYAPGDGSYAELGDLRILNALVIAAPEGGDEALISMGLASRAPQDDQLQSVSIDGTPATVEGPTDLAPGASLTIGGPDSETQAVVPAEAVTAGGSVRFTLQFAVAGAISFDAAVYSPEGDYEGYVVPAPEPSLSGGSLAPTSVPSPNVTGGETPQPTPSGPADPTEQDERTSTAEVTVDPTVPPSPS